MREKYFASIINYPLKTLDQKIWDISVDPPMIREDIKEEIMTTLVEGLKSFGYDFDDVIVSVHLTGSMGTTQYVKGTDLDVHLIPVQGLSKETFDEIQSIIRKELSGWTAGKSEHIVEYYLQNERLQELRGDVLYIMNTDEWIIRPEDVPMTYDPYEEFPDVWGETERVMNDFMVEISELQRDIVDIDVLNEYIETLDEEQRKSVEKKIRSKLQEIEEDLDLLSEGFTDVHEKRKESYAEEAWSMENYGDEYKQSLSWGPGNVSWKFLERYGLVVILANLRYLEEKDLSPEEQSEEARQLLEEFNLMLERKEA